MSLDIAVYNTLAVLRSASAVEVMLTLNRNPNADRVTTSDVNRVLYKNPELYTMLAREGLRPLWGIRAC